MNFLYPAAFFGLTSIIVLILLSLWRLRPVKTIVPSVRLWREIPDRLPPVRSWHRPRANVSLMLQVLVAAALVFAMAGPGFTRLAPAPRRIAVVVDGSAAMSPRKEAVQRELDKLDRSDDLVFVPTLDLAVSEAKTVVYISDRAPAWNPPAGVNFQLVLVGGPLKNVGIVDAGVENGKLFLRLSSPAEVRVAVDGAERRLPASAFHLADVPADARRIEASLDPDDFTEDDRVLLEREAARIDVGLEGRPDRAILAAIEADPRARVVRGGSPRVLIRIGSASGKAPLVVDVDPPDGVESWGPPETISLAKHPLTEGMEAEDVKTAQVGTLAGPVDAALILSGGKPVAAVRKPGEIAVAARYAESGWPATPSFPIFWSNVIGYGASGAAAWRAQGLLDESASRPGLERKTLDPGALGTRPLVPLRNDLTAVSIALAALLLAVLWVVERRTG
jgi:hypothetical protein